MKSLRGKNALLTGGSRGLGQVIARFLAKEGVNLALTKTDSRPRQRRSPGKVYR